MGKKASLSHFREARPPYGFRGGNLGTVSCPNWLLALRLLLVCVLGAARPGGGTCDVEETDDAIRVTTGGTEAVFDRRTGTVRRLSMQGKVIVSDKGGVVHGPRLEVERAFTDSDNWMRGPFKAAGLTQLVHHPMRMAVARNGDGTVAVTAPVRVTGAKSGGFEFAAKWTFRGDGTVRIDHEMTPFGNVPHVPRVGTFTRLDGALENMRYYGRGPWENYVDRNTGCDIGVYSSTVPEQYVDYIRPQDCGGKTDVRWVEFTDPKDGRGVRWYQVKYNGKTCWISSRYSKSNKSSSSSSSSSKSSKKKSAATATPTVAPETLTPFAPGVDGEVPSDPESFAAVDATVTKPPIVQSAPSSYIEVSGFYQAKLIESALMLDISDYTKTDTEAPNQYSNDALTLGGDTTVEYIGLRGEGYTVYGVCINMDVEAAKALLTNAGLVAVDRDFVIGFEHPATASSTANVNGYDSCINLYTDTDGRITEIDWTTYTA